MSDASEEETLDLFDIPKDYYQKEDDPTHIQHRTLNGETLTLRLVGSNPLWGHMLWQGGRILADYLETNKQELVQHRTVLELGAGAGLPSLICAISGAKQVVVTDYPDPELVENLQLNIQDCMLLTHPANIHAAGYLWGAETAEVRTYLPEAEREAGFDLLILADLLFNHSEHEKLLSTVQQTLKNEPHAQALVFFSPYRPWLLDKDLAFFELARNGGFLVESILEKLVDQVMFENDRGDEKLRRTVFGYRLSRDIHSQPVE